MKKFLSLLILSICVLASPTSAYTKHVVSNANVTVVFQENSKFSENEKLIIIEYLASDKHENQNTQRNILCSLFGHDYTEEHVTTITHRVYPTPPRCLEKQYNILHCSRCGFTQEEYISSRSIYCCE